MRVARQLLLYVGNVTANLNGALSNPQCPSLDFNQDTRPKKPLLQHLSYRGVYVRMSNILSHAKDITRGIRFAQSSRFQFTQPIQLTRRLEAEHGLRLTAALLFITGLHPQPPYYRRQRFVCGYTFLMYTYEHSSKFSYIFFQLIVHLAQSVIFYYNQNKEHRTQQLLSLFSLQTLHDLLIYVRHPIQLLGQYDESLSKLDDFHCNSYTLMSFCIQRTIKIFVFFYYDKSLSKYLCGLDNITCNNLCLSSQLPDMILHLPEGFSQQLVIKAVLQEL